MEDLICPECGRPNLGEAIKCWYCQTELTKPSSDEDTAQPVVQENVSDQTDKPEQEQENQEEDIPEWLQKIRNRIEEERDPDEELPYWKQKDIFGGEKKVRGKTNRENKSRPAKKSSQQKSEKASKNDNMPVPNAEENLNSKNSPDEPKNEDLGNLSDELPDGFVKL